MAWKHTLWIALALMVSGCINQADNKAADDATTQFFQRVAAKQYDAIYNDAAPQFRANTTHDLFVGMLQRVDRKLGACQPPVAQMNWHVNTTTEGTFRAQGYTQTCANGALTEEVTVLIAGGKVQIVGFNFNSPLLMTD